MTRLARSTGPFGIAALLALAASAAGGGAPATAPRARTAPDPPRTARDADRLLPVARSAEQLAGGSRLAKGKFLVASRALRDPNFYETVILLVDYDRRGALGVVVNRPSAVPLGEALPEVKELRRRKDVVYLGGPVGRDRMLLLVRTQNAPPESLRIFDRVYASGSLDALRDGLSRGEGVRAFAGYAGWGPGQLDAEVARGDWLIGPADAKALFEAAPGSIWRDLIERFTGDWASRPGPRLAVR